MIQQVHQDVHNDVLEIKKKIDALVGGHASRQVGSALTRSVTVLKTTQSLE